ncbi:MAG: PAS domain S-box protein [Bacteroidales bacterium]|jgi:PAS domain S-box-containing protein|nr:PAS domain S-box protein [Bacteroidales bacterium]
MDNQNKTKKELLNELEHLQNEYNALQALYNKESKERSLIATKQTEGEAYNRMLFKQSVIGLALTSMDGKLIDVNQAYANIIGRTIEDTLQLSYWDITPEKYAEQEKQQLEALRLKGTYGPYEKEYIHKNGQLIPVRLQGSIIERMGEKFIWSSVEDITESKANEQSIKLAQEQLLLTNAKWQTTFDGMKDAIFLLDTNGVILQANKASYILFQKNEAELLGKHCHEIVHQTDCRIKGCPFVKMQLSKQRETMQLLFNEKWFEITIDPILDNMGRITEIVHIICDITESKHATEKLKQSEERLELFLAQSLDGFFFMILDEPVVWNSSIDKEKTLDYVFKHQRVTKINSAMLQQYGASKEQFIGLTPNDLFTHDIQHGRKVWKDFFDNGQLHIDTHEKKFDGTDMIVEGDYICLYDSQKRITGHFGIQREVTATRLAKEKLSNQYDILLGIIESTNDLIFSLDKNYCYTSFNKNHAAVMKVIYDADIELGKSLLDYMLVKNDREIAKNNIDRALAGESITDNSFSGEESLSRQYFEVKHSPIKDTSGNIVGVAVKSQDVTKRKRAEEELKASEAKLRAIFSAMHNVIIVLDKNGRYLEIAPTNPSLLYIPFEELLGKTVQDVFPKKQADFFQDYINQCVAMQQLVTMDYTLEIENETIWFSASLTPLSSETILLVSHDITERKRAESEILKLSQAVEQSPVSIIIADLEGNIEYVNPEFIELTGYSFNEVKGKNPRILQSGDMPKETYKEMWDMILLKKIWSGEFHNKKKNGELYWEFATISPIVNETGEITNYLAVKEDITERKEIELELLKAKEKAEESDRLKSAFLANMSHEIRTPMNGILGFAGLLKEPGLSGEQQQKYIQIIEKSGARMLNIINDIVSISKIESGIVDINLSETNINNQLQFVYDSLILDADNKNLNLSFNCALPEKEAMIKTDSEKFYGIISNLVKNAIKYTDSGTIEFGYVYKGEEFEFYVKDTGIGIPKERQEAIFERFIQADIIDKMARQGAGLGLAISRAYMEMLGGKIWVESEEAMGSTFFFTLPCNLDSKEKINISTAFMDESEEKPITPEISGLKVLIAEDDETSEMLILIELENFSKEILKVTTGLEAIEICRQHPDIDLVLMDIQMPGMNGYEATHKIREFNKDVIIIAQTAFALTGDREKAIEVGCNDYISKPIKKDELLVLMQKYFNK